MSTRPRKDQPHQRRFGCCVPFPSPAPPTAIPFLAPGRRPNPAAENPAHTPSPPHRPAGLQADPNARLLSSPLKEAPEIPSCSKRHVPPAKRARYGFSRVRPEPRRPWQAQPLPKKSPAPARPRAAVCSVFRRRTNLPRLFPSKRDKVPPRPAKCRQGSRTAPAIGRKTSPTSFPSRFTAFSYLTQCSKTRRPFS